MSLTDDLCEGRYNDRPASVREELRTLANRLDLDDDEKEHRVAGILGGLTVADQDRYAHQDALKKSVIEGGGRLAQLRTQLMDGDAIRNLPAPAPLVVEVLDLDSLAVMFGRSGVGKSFVALDLALCVATGSWWYGREVTQRPVLYIAAEGAVGQGVRLDAWQQHTRLDTSGLIRWLPERVNLLDAEDGDALRSLAVELDAGLVVVDTLARCMPGGDENSSRDMGQAVEVLSDVRQATGACVLAIHHTGKDPTQGARGHSSLKAALDTELRIEGTEGAVSIHSDKQRNHRDGYRLERLRLVEVAGSCVLARAAHDSDDEADMNDNDLQALEDLRVAAGPDGLSFTAWNAVTDVAERTLARVRTRLLEKAEIANVGTQSRPKYLPASVAAMPTPIRGVAVAVSNDADASGSGGSGSGSNGENAA